MRGTQACRITDRYGRRGEQEGGERKEGGREKALEGQREGREKNGHMEGRKGKEEALGRAEEAR
ncbi:hypothetical protein DSECCO2_639900 [anaerobic digester metagenome]